MAVRLTDIRPDLIDRSKWGEFKRWLLSMPLNARTRKELVVEWCRLTKEKLTREKVKEVGGI